MHITFKEDEPFLPDYPKFMIDHNGHLLVYMTDESTGYVIFDELDRRESGEFKDDWAIASFKDFKGKITIR